ncbi:hypothetical protein [uncultured Tenacibaculum sp.]|uniref:hypothetical protein n=1 Tax=uncultured Tenacibaculum sp. TaxID=174713 RepID=UPI0026318BB9|nr:hypothetical protein [uncultured Tenacibaculum sp.]
MKTGVYNLEESAQSILSILDFNKKRLSSQFKESLGQEGGVKILNNTVVLRKEMTVGGTQKLVDSNTKKISGISDFDGNRFKDDEVHIYERVRLGYETHAESGKAAQLMYANKMTASFRNAILRVRQDGVVLGEIPVADIYNKYTGRTMRDDYFELKHPIVLVGGTDYDLEYEFPDGSTSAANKEYLELVFDGHKVVRSTK